MVSIDIKVDASEAITALEKFDVTKVAMEVLEKGGEDILEEAKTNVHVISGNLRDSGRSETHGKSVVISFNKEYASIEEARVGGKKYEGPHAYLKPAVDLEVPHIEQDLEDKLDDEVNH